MFNFIKKSILTTLLLSLLVSPVAQAQDVELSQKAANLKTVLMLQFDVSDILEDLKSDLLLNSNTCKQADRYQVLNAQQNIYNNLLNNFENINQQQRESLIQSYQDLEIEYQFLLTLDTLIKEGVSPESKNLHISRIQNKIPLSSVDQRVPQLYDSLFTQYEARVRLPDPQGDGFLEGEYTNCPTSWSAIKERANNIQNELAQISQEYDEFKQALASIRSTAKDTANPSNLKSIFIVNPIQAVKQGTIQSWQDLQIEIQQNKQQFFEIANKPDEVYQQILNQNQALLTNRTDVAGLLLGSNDITQISQVLSERSQQQLALQTKVNSYSANQVTASHFDYGIQALTNLSFQTPLIIQQNQSTFKKINEDGMLKLSKQIYDRQCVINP